jgi:hypothetical protein
MYISYTVISPYSVKSQYEISIKDSDFEEIVKVDANTNGGVDIITAIVKVYESRSLRPEANVALYIKSTAERFNVPIRVFFERVAELNAYVKANKDSIEKYILLF